MKNVPVVSVVIPCYQSEKFVRTAIDSVKVQTYPNLEVIAIDDGSTDNTLSIIQEYADFVNILNHPGGVNRGVSLSRKLGVDHATGKYVAFLDSDDYFEPEKIEAQVEILERNPRVVLCHTAIKQVNEIETHYNCQNWFNFNNERVEYNLKNRQTYLVNNQICNSSVMIRTKTLNKIPCQNKQLYQFEDWLMWTFASDYGDFIYIPEKLVNYRVHSNSATAAILQNNLINMYSHLEFYINIIGLSCNAETKRKAVVLLMGILNNIYAEYMECQKNNVNNTTFTKYFHDFYSDIVEKYPDCVQDHGGVKHIRTMGGVIRSYLSRIIDKLTK